MQPTQYLPGASPCPDPGCDGVIPDVGDARCRSCGPMLRVDIGGDRTEIRTAGGHTVAIVNQEGSRMAVRIRDELVGDGIPTMIDAVKLAIRNAGRSHA